MQACTLDFENEKLDRQNMQHQLHVILKELRKARNQITQLESLVSLEWLDKNLFHLSFSSIFLFICQSSSQNRRIQFKNSCFLN